MSFSPCFVLVCVHVSLFAALEQPLISISLCVASFVCTMDSPSGLSRIDCPVISCFNLQ